MDDTGSTSNSEMVVDADSWKTTATQILAIQLLDKTITLGATGEQGTEIQARGHCVSVMAAVDAEHTVKTRYYLVSQGLGQWYGAETWRLLAICDERKCDDSQV